MTFDHFDLCLQTLKYVFSFSEFKKFKINKSKSNHSTDTHDVAGIISLFFFLPKWIVIHIMFSLFFKIPHKHLKGCRLVALIWVQPWHLGFWDWWSMVIINDAKCRGYLQIFRFLKSVPYYSNWLSIWGLSQLVRGWVSWSVRNLTGVSA